jgi:hypothetical protein
VANPANGSARSATLAVTAQARPPDVIGPDSDMQGLHCGGDSPDIGILLGCRIADGHYFERSFLICNAARVDVAGNSRDLA